MYIRFKSNLAKWCVLAIVQSHWRMNAIGNPLLCNTDELQTFNSDLHSKPIVFHDYNTITTSVESQKGTINIHKMFCWEPEGHSHCTKYTIKPRLEVHNYGHDPFWMCFWRASTWFHNNSYYNGTIYIRDNVIVLSDLVESSGYSSKTLQKGSCPYAPLDEVLRYGNLAPFWFSTGHLWIVIAPSWLSTDLRVREASL